MRIVVVHLVRLPIACLNMILTPSKGGDVDHKRRCIQISENPCRPLLLGAVDWMLRCILWHFQILHPVSSLQILIQTKVWWYGSLELARSSYGSSISSDDG